MILFISIHFKAGYLSESEKQILTDALYNCLNFLKRHGLIKEHESSDYQSDKAISLGVQLTEAVLKISQELIIVNDEELYLPVQEESMEFSSEEEDENNDQNEPENSASTGDRFLPLISSLMYRSFSAILLFRTLQFEAFKLKKPC